MEAIEVSVRCSESGGLARVIFSRSGKRYPFEIREIKTGSSVSTSAPDPDPLSLNAGKRGDDVVRIDLSSSSLDARTVNWNGFVCPHCRKRSSVTVMRCGRCRQLVCGATYVPLEKSRYYFSCAACGHKTHGRKLGTIETFGAKPVRSTTHDVPALPPGRKLLDAAKRILPRGKTWP